ncbi:hypothetical protein [Caulobacter sp.]|uniref:hypothetical protein n=1 Tax=Caulobacter sp. TaxID=78 RepID=UPI001B153031|nr:hypothetical protein [Caulobacter sp.]MBO9544121.1 hypothetical protein [Caulobacter sp.]
MRRILSGIVISAIAVLAIGVAPAMAQFGGYMPPPPPARQDMKNIDFLRTQKSGPRIKPRESGNPMQVKMARELAAQLKIPCDVTDAAELSDTPSKVPSYELVCRDAMGWIINRKSVADVQPLDCLAVQDSAEAAGKAWPRGLYCLMRGNFQPAMGLAPIAAKIAPDCEVANGAYLGSGGTPPITRYELSCKNGKGYVVDNPAPGSAATLSSMTCAEAAQAGAPCKLGSRKQAG